MTRLPFREYHLLRSLTQFEGTPFPLDFFLNSYFRTHKQLGSKDKQWIADTFYELIRWKGLLDFLSKKSTWEERFAYYQQIDPTSFKEDRSLESHIRVSFPPFYFQLLKENFGEERALELAWTSNTRAPTTVRVNALKTTRESLLDLWKGSYALEPCTDAPQGIRFLQKIQLHSLEEFKAGWFEIQDEGSQEIAALVKIKPKEHFLDYCAGSGGKTLAIAPLMKGAGQIYVHDIRPSILLQAKKRLKRAGVQNVQFLLPPKGRMDWMLLDVPCSGSGTLRRNPDMKWKFTPERLSSLIAEQRKIFLEALPFVRKGGKIVYATCSLFREENEEQIQWFLQNHPVVLEEEMQLLPEQGGKDGFFGAVLLLR